MAVKRKTRQRDAIFGAIRGADGPLSVAEIHELAGRAIPGLGIATVYRNVRSLRDEGAITAVELPGEDPRYEPSGRGHHHHFRCTDCERTFDLEGCPVGVERGATLPGGYRVDGHSLTFYGSCEDCNRV
ncbi:Fur family transcriptional regulator [Rubrobacter indicoceani]|uniref:Fur family transcriptional regulator n=1 Tax=Rubrobacter indicoceani TaxID=2051957 RepID=UPI000E5A5867|nr:transcriptional repressor [Rubrobacter indicoceani]